MKIKKYSKNKKIIVYVVVVVAIIIGAFGYRLWLDTQTTDQSQHNDSQTSRRINSVDLNPPSNSEVQAGIEKKKDALEDNDTPTSDTVGVTITSANQNDPLIQIRTLIDYVGSEGSCELTMIHDTHTVTKKTTIQTLSNSSTCAGFDVPLSELSTGTWTIRVAVTADSQTGSATGSIRIQ
jgi:cytoskeletal protein RodZ